MELKRPVNLNLLQVLIDEAKSSLYQVQLFSKAIGHRSGDEFNTAALATIVKQLNSFCDHLQVGISLKYARIKYAKSSVAAEVKYSKLNCKLQK